MLFRSTGQRLTVQADGRLFDYDFPGTAFTSANQVGDHAVYNAAFEQCVAVLPSSINLRDAAIWPSIERGLAVSPMVTWRSNLTARVTAVAGTNVQLSVQGAVTSPA